MNTPSFRNIKSTHQCFDIHNRYPAPNDISSADFNGTLHAIVDCGQTNERKQYWRCKQNKHAENCDNKWEMSFEGGWRWRISILIESTSQGTWSPISADHRLVEAGPSFTTAAVCQLQSNSASSAPYRRQQLALPRDSTSGRKRYTWVIKVERKLLDRQGKGYEHRRFSLSLSRRLQLRTSAN